MEIWNTEARNEYRQTWENDRIGDMNFMEKLEISKEYVRAQLKLTKRKKAPGPDNLKPDFYVELLKSDGCMEVISKGMNLIIESGRVPEKLKISKTVMLEKKTKPTVRDLRPIALMNCSYKLFMGTVRGKLEEHLQRCNMVSELQSGSTGGRRATDNIFILKYCVEQAFRTNKPLYVVSIDFRKAFNSIDRGKLIAVLMDNKVNPFTIDIVSEIYVGDKTKISLNNAELAEIEVTSGIRLGCNGSTALFLVVTYYIIEKLKENLRGFRMTHRKINCLFYVDDGLILSESKIGAEDAVDVLEQVAAECGLSMNKEKCAYMVWNQRWKGTKDVRGIQGFDEIKYLGITIDNSRQCFTTHIGNGYNGARKMLAVLYSILGNCCNRLLIGKTFWKGLALSSFMYGSDVVVYGSNGLGKLQSFDNQAYRYIWHFRETQQHVV